MDVSDGSPEEIMSDHVVVNGIVTQLILTSDGKLRWTERGQQCLIIDEEVLGFDVEEPTLTIKAVVDSGRVICCGGSKGCLVRKDFVFSSLNKDSLGNWSRGLRHFLDSLGRPKRLFIFVNPFGGKKSAWKIFHHDVKPLLDDADVQITVGETKHQLHAKEVAMTLDLTKYDGIVCISGDGILAEVVNGLLAREDWNDAIKMPLGIIPAGTGNGMVKSILDSVGEPCNPFSATLVIIRGHRHPLDVATIWQNENKFFSVLMLAWGLIADIDVESEKYRWMGSRRIDFYAIQRILCLRRYRGHVAFVPAPGFESFGEPTSSNCTFTDSRTQGTRGPILQARQLGYQGPDVNLMNLNWRSISGPFISIWLHNVPWGGEDILAAPHAMLSDGCLDLIIIKECPKFVLMRLMTELNSGGHIKSSYVIYLKVKAFMLEPGPHDGNPTKGSIIDVDGEVLARGNRSSKWESKALMMMMAYEKLQISVDQGLATVFSPHHNA